MKVIFLLFLVFGSSFAIPFQNNRADTCGYEACTATDPDKLNVHIIPHSHDDVGWLKTVDGYYYQDVQRVISTVVTALRLNPERRFIQVETAYFKKWWEKQNNETKATVQELIDGGRLEIIGGGWSMNDEGAAHYQSTIDQYTYGLRFLDDNLGKCARSKVAWQIDPFGHSREQASIAAQMGYDSFFFARLDYRDKDERKDNKAMDLLWRGSANLDDTDILTSVLYAHYSAPSNFCFDYSCNDDPIIDDEESYDYNYEKRVKEFGDVIRDRAPHYPTNNLLVTFGDDFKFQAALNEFINLDLLIKGFDKFEQTYDGKPIKVFYSTPSCYTKAVNDYVNNNNYYMDLKKDDFFPYADGSNTYWTGYFTSRPASKRFERIGNNLLQVTKQLGAVGQLSYSDKNIDGLRDAMGVMQHHDAITGTEKQAVTCSYHLYLNNAIEGASSAASSVLSTLITGENNGDSLELKSPLLVNVSYCEQSKSDKFTVVIYNPLSRPISSPVSLPVESENWKIVDPDGNDVSYQTIQPIRDFSYVPDIETSPYTLTFVAANIPQLGYNVYQFEKVDGKRKEIPATNSKTTRIGYDDTGFEIDESTGLLKSVTMNGVTVDVKQEFLYYSSQDSSGAYIFVPTEQEPKKIAQDSVTVTTISGDVYEGVIQEFSDWAKQIIKVYKDEKSYIEFDWIIGPIDISEGVGKEIVTRFTTSLGSDGKYYTDSNGRELIERIRNYRPTYIYTNEQPVSGNYYPINNRIVLKDSDNEIAIITDRSQGGGSINDGQVEIMIHRACHHDDGRGVGENLNEQQYDQGIVVRGQHYFVLSPISGNDGKSAAAIQRDVAQRKLLSPWTFITDKDVSSQLKNLKYNGITEALPDNVQILTLEPWKDNQLLIRLEHVLEKHEDDNLSKEVTVDLTNLFDKFTITEAEIMTLSGNVPIEEKNRLKWPVNEASKIKHNGKNNVKDFTFTLAPMEIITLLATVTYK